MTNRPLSGPTQRFERRPRVSKETPATTYDESSFDVLKGLEPVRKVPGMYTRTRNPLHIAQEVIDNATDEAQGGFATKVSVTLHKDGSVSVADNGRGIPVGLHPTQGIPVVVLAFTQLHAGAKFRKGNSYTHAGGLHGVGVSVTNALSHKLEVTVKRDGKEHYVFFEDGDRVISPVTVVGDCGPRTSGTRVRFWPDAKYFDSAAIPVAELETLLRAKAMLLSGLTVVFSNELTGESNTWCYASGIRDYLTERLEGQALVGELFFGQGAAKRSEDSADEDRAAWAVAWTQEPGKGESYVNTIPTPLGGTHDAGFRAGLFEALRDYCDHHALMPRGITLQSEDVASRAHYVLSASIMHTQFQGQTKDKLTSREAVRIVASIVRDLFMSWLMAHPDSAKLIAELAIKQATARMRSGKQIEKRKSSGVATLPGKLTDCQSGDIRQNELILVEGDSAGGGCKVARDRELQALLPLRGKVWNTWEVLPSELYANQEVHDISVALGVDPHSPDAPDSVLDSLRYGKVIILADADVDGSHIQTLLLALFLKHFPKLVTKGHVFIARPPLFRVDAPSKGRGSPAQTLYCLTEEERNDTVDALLGKGYRRDQLTISRFKGLGEMNPAQLKETVLNPDTRILLPMCVKSTQAANDTFTLLMGKGEAASRRNWLEVHGNEAEVDL